MGKSIDNDIGGGGGDIGNRDGGEFKFPKGGGNPGGFQKLGEILTKGKKKKAGYVPHRIGFSGGFGTTSERKSLFSRSKKFRAN